MFLLAVLCEVVPKCVMVPRIVFAQARLGFSSSCPHNDSWCWRWGRVECVGTCWRIVFSSQLLGDAPSCAVPWRRDVPEELRREPEDGAQAMHSPLSSQHQTQMAAYKNLPFTSRQLQQGNWKLGLWVCWTGEETKPFNICLCTLPITQREKVLSFGHKRKYWHGLK